MLLDLIAAHQSASPALLEALANTLHVRRPLPARAIRSLLANPNTPARAADQALAALTYHVMAPAPGVRVAEGATIEDVLGHVTVLTPAQWLWVHDALPEFAERMASCAVSAAVRTRGEHAAMLLSVLGRTSTLPVGVRSAALRTLALMGVVSEEILASVARVAVVAPGAFEGAAFRARDPKVTTMLNAAASPYPDLDGAAEIAGRLLRALRGRPSNPSLTSLCALLRAGARANDVAELLLADDQTPAGVLHAIARTPTVASTARCAAAQRALLGVGSRPEAWATTEAVLVDGFAGGELLSAYIAALEGPQGGIDRLLAHPAFGAGHVADLVERITRGEVELSAPQLGNLATLAVTDPGHLPALARAMRAVPARGQCPFWSAVVTVAERVACGTAGWEGLPVEALSYLNALTPGLAFALDRCLDALLAETNRPELAVALHAMPVATMTGPLSGVFATARGLIA